MTDLIRTSPDVLPSVSYQSVRYWQRCGAKPLRQCSPSCQHQGGRELGLRSAVNPGESFKSVVTYDEPKMLTGSNQKVSGQVVEFTSLYSQMWYHRRNDETSSPLALTRNVVSLYGSSNGKQAARRAHHHAGRGGWRKPRPSGNQMDRSCL
jgi:hypothetical protein